MGLGAYPYEPSYLANKENIPLSDSEMAFQDGGEVPSPQAGADVPQSQRNSFQRSGLASHELSDTPFRRASSHYADDEENWEDVRTNSDLGSLNNRMSAFSNDDSIANVSDDAGTTGLGFHSPSYHPPQGQPTLRHVTGLDGTTSAMWENPAHRILFDRPQDRNQDWKTTHKRNVKQVERIMKNEILENEIYDKLTFGGSKVDKEERKRRLDQLEQIRKLDKESVREGTANVVNILSARRSAASLPRSARNQNSYENVMNAANLDAADAIQDDARSGMSSTRRLIHRRSSLSTPGTLDYSPTVGTFATVRDDTPPVPALPRFPQAALTPLNRRNATPSTMRTGQPEEIEMRSLTRCGRRSMRGQMSLMPLQLGDTSSATSAPTGRPLTDDEMMAREPGWTMDPRSSTLGPRSRPGGLHVGLPVHHDEERALLAPDQARHTVMLREQKVISRKYYARTIWFPVTAIMFGLGMYDGKAKAMSKHGVEEMCPNHKYWALWIAAPLGLVGYGVLGLVAAVITIVVTH